MDEDLRTAGIIRSNLELLKEMGLPWSASDETEDDDEETGDREPIASENNKGKASGKGKEKNNEGKSDEPSARPEKKFKASSKADGPNPGPEFEPEFCAATAGAFGRALRDKALATVGG